MDGQLDPVKQDIRNIQERIVRYEQKLAVAEQAGNKEEEKSLINLLSRLQEEKNILLRSQAASKPCLQLVHGGSPVFTSCCTPSVNDSCSMKVLCKSKAFVVARAFLSTLY